MKNGTESQLNISPTMLESALNDNLFTQKSQALINAARDGNLISFVELMHKIWPTLPLLASNDEIETLLGDILWQAGSKGDLSIARWLVAEEEFDFTAFNFKEMQADQFLEAASYGEKSFNHRNFAQFLWEYKKNPEIDEDMRASALRSAAKGDARVLAASLMLPPFKNPGKEEFIFEALINAAENGHIHIVRMLLSGEKYLQYRFDAEDIAKAIIHAWGQKNNQIELLMLLLYFSSQKKMPLKDIETEIRNCNENAEEMIEALDMLAIQSIPMIEAEQQKKLRKK